MIGTPRVWPDTEGILLCVTGAKIAVTGRRNVLSALDRLTCRMRGNMTTAAQIYKSTRKREINLSRCSLLWITLAALGSCSFGQSIVAPNANATVTGNDTSGSLVGSMSGRIQFLINPSQFPGGLIHITGFTFRAAPATGALNLNASGDIYLSTSPNWANSTGHTLMSTTFASNVGPDNTLVASLSNFAISGPSCGIPGPCQFANNFVFTTPFPYNSANGPLLIDIQATSFGGSGPGQMDVIDCPNTSCVINSESATPLGTATGTLNAGSSIVRLTYSRPFNDFAGDGLSGALLYDPTQGQSYTALSNGNGTYTYVPNLFSPNFTTLITGDYNGDGRTDLILYNSGTGLAYIGLGNGTGGFDFQSLFWSPGYDTVITGEINRDGKTDVVLYNSNTGTLYTGISNGDGTFTYEYHLVSQNFTFVRLADATGDGKADLILYRSSDGVAYLGIGDGTGAFTFNPLSISAGYNLADTGDLNGDGKADIILYNATNGNAATGISNGSSGFTFTPLVFSPGFTSVRLADYTGHATADVTVYNKNTAVAYFGTGNGDGTFSFQSLFWSPGYDYVIPEDVNGDGKTDIVLYNSTTGTEYTGLSNGNGTFDYTYSYWGIGRTLAR
jgi:hypothetical protein